MGCDLLELPGPRRSSGARAPACRPPASNLLPDPERRVMSFSGYGSRERDRWALPARTAGGTVPRADAMSLGFLVCFATFRCLCLVRRRRSAAQRRGVLGTTSASILRSASNATDVTFTRRTIPLSQAAQTPFAKQRNSPGKAGATPYAKRPNPFRKAKMGRSSRAVAVSRAGASRSQNAAAFQSDKSPRNGRASARMPCGVNRRWFWGRRSGAQRCLAALGSTA